MIFSVKRLWVIVTLFIALASVIGCSKGSDKIGAQPTNNSPAEAIEPTAPNTSATKSDITKEQQSKEMPMPGQANDHSTLDSKATQKLSKP